MYLHANGEKNGVKYKNQVKDEGQKICIKYKKPRK